MFIFQSKGESRYSRVCINAWGMFWGMFCGLQGSAMSVVKKDSFVAWESTLSKLRISLKMSLSLGYWGIIGYDLKNKLKAPWQNKGSGQDIPVICLLHWKIMEYFFYHSRSGR